MATTVKKIGTAATFTLLLLGTAVTAQNSRDISAEETGEETTAMTLVLNPPAPSANSGDTITFKGRLSSNGDGMAGKTVLIKDDDPHGMDNVLGARLTGSSGEFVIQWTAERTDPRDNTVEAYAEFSDYPDYGSAKSSQYVITVMDVHN